MAEGHYILGEYQERRCNFWERQTHQVIFISIDFRVTQLLFLIQKIYQQKCPLWGKQKWWKTWRNSNGLRFLLSVYIKADWKPRMMNVLWFMQQSCARFQRKGQAWSCLSNDEQCVCIFQRFSTYFDIFWFTGQLLVPQLHKLRWATECFSNEPLDPQWST